MQPQYGATSWAGFAEFADSKAGSGVHHVGVVRSYDPSKKLYLVSVEGIGDRQCRRLLTGLDKPIPVGGGCVVVELKARPWLIVGELDRISRAPDKALPGASEQAAASEAAVGAALTQKDPAQAPSFRPLDYQGMAEEPQFAGDAGLENRTKDHLRRSRVKVYSFGDILLWASGLCHSLYHKATNTIYRRCRNEIFQAAGVLLQVLTPADGDQAGKTTRRLVLRRNALDTTVIDKIRSEGQILASDGGSGDELLIAPVADRGERTIWGDHRAEEIDNDLGTYRFQQETGGEQRITGQVGSFEAENAAHPVSGTQNPSTPSGVAHPAASTAYGDAAEGNVERGVHLDLGGLRVTYDQDRGELEVLNTASEETQRVIMKPDQLLMERAGQSFSLDNSGLTIRVSSYTLEVDGAITQTAGGNMTINASDMDVNLG